jgi:hypothetical protein
VHRSLRPSGALLDLQPQPQEYRTLDVRLGDELRRAGQLYRQAFFLADIRAARVALEASVAERLFRMDEELEYDHVEHYDSVDSWTACLAKPRVGELVADEGLIESACMLMPEGKAEIIVTQRARAARFVRC